MDIDIDINSKAVPDIDQIQAQPIAAYSCSEFAFSLGQNNGRNNREKERENISRRKIGRTYIPRPHVI